jgi:hypothetical protein
MQRLTVKQWVVIGLVLVIVLTARQWPWPLQTLAVAAAGVGFAALAWREAGGRLPWLPQRPQVTYWRGRPVPLTQRPQRLRITRSVLVYGLLATLCLTALAAVAWRLLT